MYNVAIEAVDLRELKSQLVDLCHVFGLMGSIPPIEIPLDPELTAPDVPIAPPIPTPPKKKKKEPEPQPTFPIDEPQAAPEIVEPIAEPLPKPVAPATPIPSKEEVFNELKTLSTAKGMIVAKTLLLKFNCARISELPAARYAEFIEACKALITA